MKFLRKFDLYLIIVSALILFAGLNSFPLTDRDEGEYAASAFEMLQTGDYVVPHLNGKPYLEKPPLYFWLLAISLKIFGANEFGARFPSALAAFFLTVIIFYFVKRHFRSSSHALQASLILLGNPLFLVHARACITDLVLTLFLFAAFVAFYILIYSEKWLFFPALIGSLSISLAYLTKGPVSIAIFLPAILLYAFFQKDISKILNKKTILLFLFIFFSINLPWHIIIYKRMGMSFFETFYYTQNFERFTKILLGHGGGPFFYFLVLAIGFYPLFPFVIRPIYDGILSREGKKGFETLSAIAVVWSILVLSISATKQLNYILPVLPFLSILAGVRLDSLQFETETLDKFSKFERYSFLVCGVIWAIVFSFLLFGLEKIWNALSHLIRFDSTAYALSTNPPSNIPLWSIIFLGLILFIIGCIYFWKDKKLFLSGALAFSFIFAELFLPYLAKEIQEPAKILAKQVIFIKKKTDKIKGKKIRAVSYGLWKPSMIFYSEMPITRFKVRHLSRLCLELKDDDTGIFVFTRAKLIKKLTDNCKSFRPITIKKGYLLGGNQKALKYHRTYFPIY